MWLIPHLFLSPFNFSFRFYFIRGNIIFKEVIYIKLQHRITLLLFAFLLLTCPFSAFANEIDTPVDNEVPEDYVTISTLVS